MHLSEIKKKATAFKKTEGYASALNFLAGAWSILPPEEKEHYSLTDLFGKIYTYLPHDLENAATKQFVEEIWSTGLVPYKIADYYRITKDYETFHNKIKEAITKLNPNADGNYCSEMAILQGRLCEYYQAKGLDKAGYAASYIYSLIMSYLFDAAEYISSYSQNFYWYGQYVRYGEGFEKEFLNYSHTVLMYPDVENDQSIQQCLKTLNTKLSNIELDKEICNANDKTLPVHLGIKFDITNDLFKDLEGFCLTYFTKEQFEDIDNIYNLSNQWRKNISGKSLPFINSESNRILKLITG